MNARHKLNIAYFQGALLLAAAIGIVAESWIVFLAMLAFFIAVSLYVGDIRLTRRP